MIYESVDASKVVKNRRAIEKKMVEANPGITTVDLAEFFYCPIKAVKNDVDELGLKLNDSKSWVDIEKLRDHRDKLINRGIKSGKSEQSVLESYGLFRMPPEINLSSEHRRMEELGLREETVAKVERSIYNHMIGISLIHSKKNMGLSKLEVEMFKSLSSDNKEAMNQVWDFGDKLIEEGQQKETVETMLGRKLGLLRKYHEEYDKNYRNASDNVSKRNALKNALKEECYNRWVSGECTQQELALEYNVTRITVMNWCREKKLEHIEDRQDPLIRQRNMKKEQTLYYNQKKEEVVKLREEKPEMSAEAIAKELKVSSSFCKNTLRQEGLLATKYEKEGKETIVRGVKEAKRAYDHNIYAHFGYGPNKGEFKNRDVNSYVRMKDDQHQMKAELRKDRELERCIKLGKGAQRLSSRYLESEGKER